MGEDHAWRAAEIVPQFISEVEVDCCFRPPHLSKRDARCSRSSMPGPSRF